MRDFDYLWGVEICLAVMQGGHEMFFSYDLVMSDKKFYIRRYRHGDGKAQDLDGKDLSLEDDFGHVFYKSLTGVNSRGEQKGLYVETYPESDSYAQRPIYPNGWGHTCDSRYCSDAAQE